MMDNLKNFVVDHSPKSYFGRDSHKKTGEILKSFGCKRVILIYDPVIGSLGLAAKVAESIESAGITVIHFGNVEPEPSSSSVNQAGEVARRNEVDGVVGVGGGSSLDTAKGVNLLLSNPGSLEDYIGANRGIKPIIKKYPLVLLPTTAGTSAEITPVFVVSESSTGKKTGARNRGDVAIIDPLFEVGVPPRTTASTGIDMLAHATESLINPTPHALTEIMDEQVIRIAFKFLPRAYQNGGDLEAREQLAFACMMTGYAMADKGTYVGHACADRITNKCHCVHGVACAPSVLIAVRYAVDVCPEKLMRIAKVLEIPLRGTDRETGFAVLNAYRSLIYGLGLKNMHELGLDDDYIAFMGKDLCNDNRFRNSKYPPDYKLAAKAIEEEWAEE